MLANVALKKNNSYFFCLVENAPGKKCVCICICDNFQEKRRNKVKKLNKKKFAKIDTFFSSIDCKIAPSFAGCYLQKTSDLSLESFQDSALEELLVTI